MFKALFQLNNWTLQAGTLLADATAESLPQALAGGRSLPAKVPGLVHESLLAANAIAEPLIGEQCFECEWVEGYQWVYRTQFDAPQGLAEGDVLELFFESIDGTATIWLNGAQIAEHRNSYRPLAVNVGAAVQPTGNVLEVRIELGLDVCTIEESREPDGVSFATEETLGYRKDRGEPRRIFLRKPAYGFGWDWQPRVATIGIAGSVCLRVSRAARIERLCAATLFLESGNAAAQVKVTAGLEGLHYYSSINAVLCVQLTGPDGELAYAERRPVLVGSGFNEVDFTFTVANPQLWWPRPYGAQPLYELKASLETIEGEVLDACTRQTGIRTLRLLCADTFAFEINGRSVFCQGGNWVPPDALYTRPTDAAYRRLIESAVGANMNILRIWGGGNYEREVFYDTCDQLGVLVWQDFMFACSPYPDHLGWFREEVALEARHQVRRLSSHACLALFCGSNENSWGFRDWWGDRTQRGAYIYNEILPRAVRADAPHVPYWIGSPYGGKAPNEVGSGNNHFWKEEGGTLCPDLAGRINLTAHDTYHSFFISEYGFHGPCSLRETRRYLGVQDFDRTSFLWVHHTNTRRYEDTLRGAVQQVYGIEMQTASNEDYLLYGALWQGIAYAYSLDAARYRQECSGAILWMLNEAWGEAGWGIIDHATDRKASWYFVRRALAPERLILRRQGESNVLVALLYRQIATAADSYSIEVRLNLAAGGYRLLGAAERTAVVGQTHEEVLRIDLGNQTLADGDFISAHGSVDGRALDGVLLWQGGYAALLGNGEAAEATVVQCSVKSVAQAEPLVLVVEANRFVHALHFSIDDGDLPCSDNYFDLFAGESRAVTVELSDVDPERVCIGWIDGSGRIVRRSLRELIAPVIA